MDKNQIATDVLEIIQDVLGEDNLSNIDHNKRFKDQLEIDSMDFLDIVMGVKEKYDIEVPADDFAHFETMSLLSIYIETRLSAQAA